MAEDLFQSTLPIQGETEVQIYASVAERFQSTLPIQGETSSAFDTIHKYRRFQSTLPIQGETVQPEASIRVNWHFNPLSLYRERRQMNN